MSQQPIDVEQFDSGDSYPTFSDLFEPLQILGNGSFGQVLAVKEKSSNYHFAVKIVHKKLFSREKIAFFKKESEILKQLKHPNIIKLIKIVETANRMILVMEWMRGGHLQSLIDQRIKEGKKFTDEEVSKFIKALASGVEYIHKKDIIHRDIKPENILLENRNDLSSVKIIDFGLSAQYEATDSGNTTHSFDDHVGTRIYMAPEMWFNDRHSKPVDIWSIGIIMFIMLTGKHPIYEKGDSKQSYIKKLESVKFEFPINFRKMARSLFTRLMKVDPTERYTAEQIKSHPWVSRKFDEQTPMTNVERTRAFQQSESFERILKAMIIMYSKFAKNTKEIDPEYLEKIEDNNQTVVERQWSTGSDGLLSLIQQLQNESTPRSEFCKMKGKSPSANSQERQDFSTMATLASTKLRTQNTGVSKSSENSEDDPLEHQLKKIDDDSPGRGTKSTFYYNNNPNNNLKAQSDDIPKQLTLLSKKMEQKEERKTVDTLVLRAQTEASETPMELPQNLIDSPNGHAVREKRRSTHELLAITKGNQRDRQSLDNEGNKKKGHALRGASQGSSQPQGKRLFKLQKNNTSQPNSGRPIQTKPPPGSNKGRLANSVSQVVGIGGKNDSDNQLGRRNPNAASSGQLRSRSYKPTTNTKSTQGLKLNIDTQANLAALGQVQNAIYTPQATKPQLPNYFSSPNSKKEFNFGGQKPAKNHHNHIFKGKLNIPNSGSGSHASSNNNSINDSENRSHNTQSAHNIRKEFFSKISLNDSKNSNADLKQPAANKKKIRVSSQESRQPKVSTFFTKK